MTEPPPSQWASRLQTVLGERGRVTVVAETDSTQEAARRLRARPGDAVVALRQVAGRGRLGRRWHDPHGEGVAVTYVAPVAAPERLALGSAVGVAEALERLRAGPVGIKWPNDIVVASRKLAGILIENADGRALIGVGVNVRQKRWPPELAGRAVSLAELGAAAGRLETLETLLAALPKALGRPDEALLRAYRRRDVLVGQQATFGCDGTVVTGRIVSLDPARGLVVETATGRRFLAAATTTLLQDA